MSFEFILSADPKAAALFETACDLMVNTFAADGVTLTAAEIREHVAALPALRLACLTSDALDVETAKAEIRRGVPGVGEQARSVELRAALERGEERMLKELSLMSPAERMALGRKLAAEKKTRAVQKPELTIQQQAEQLLRIGRLPPQQRINAAREAGLL